MPTVDEWDAALQAPRIVQIESSAQLLNEVQRKQHQRDGYLAARNKPVPLRKPLQTVAGYDPPLELSIQPIQLLHRLGVVTTPAVENLADLCSTWAYYRYLWAFEFPHGGLGPDWLRLSSHAMEIDFHQKGLMSDQLGVGMAALLMGALFSASEAADVSTALNDPAWNFTLGRESPDYLFFNPAQTHLYVVECKGTRGSRQAAVDQLRRGTEQLPSLEFQDGRLPPSGLVIGTMMNRTRFRVLLIDPPGDDEPQIDAFGDDGPQIEEGERPRKTGIRSWEIPNSEKFELATRSVSQAKALAFSGFDDAAAKKMANLYERRRAVRRSAPRRTVGTENEFGRFSGVQESIIVQEGVRVEIFQGLDETLRNAYLRDDRDEIVAVHDRVAAVAIAKHPDSTLRGFAVGRDQRFDTRILRSVGPDGTLLEIRLTPG